MYFAPRLLLSYDTPDTAMNVITIIFVVISGFSSGVFTFFMYRAAYEVGAKGKRKAEEERSRYYFIHLPFFLLIMRWVTTPVTAMTITVEPSTAMRKGHIMPMTSL